MFDRVEDRLDFVSKYEIIIAPLAFTPLYQEIHYFIKDEPIKTLVKESEVLEVPEKPDAPEKPVLLPSKIYTSSNGETLPSEEMAELIEFGINKINKQLQSVTNVKEIKKLKDKKRVLLVTVYYNPDIKQFMK